MNTAYPQPAGVQAGATAEAGAAAAATLPSPSEKFTLQPPSMVSTATLRPYFSAKRETFFTAISLSTCTESSRAPSSIFAFAIMSGLGHARPNALTVSMECLLRCSGLCQHIPQSSIRECGLAHSREFGMCKPALARNGRLCAHCRRSQGRQTLTIRVARGVDSARNAHDALNRIRRGLDDRPRRIDHFGIKKHRSATARLHAVRSRRHARRNAGVDEALIQIEAFSARANEHVACIFRLKHR